MNEPSTFYLTEQLRDLRILRIHHQGQHLRVHQVHLKQNEFSGLVGQSMLTEKVG